MINFLPVSWQAKLAAPAIKLLCVGILCAALAASTWWQTYSYIHKHTVEPLQNRIKEMELAEINRTESVTSDAGAKVKENENLKAIEDARIAEALTEYKRKHPEKSARAIRSCPKPNAAASEPDSYQVLSEDGYATLQKMLHPPKTSASGVQR